MHSPSDVAGKLPRSSFAPSPYQAAVFADVVSGTGHTVIRARAGSGKTTTIMQALEVVPRGCSVLLLAFNTAIVAELKGRVPQGRGIEVATCHSYGNRAIYSALGRVSVNKDRVPFMLKAYLGDNHEEADLRRALAKTVDFAKQTLCDLTPEAIDAMIDERGIDVLTEDPKQRAWFIETALWTLNNCKVIRGEIDFADMIWLPTVLGLRTPKYDRVFVDETQDLNRAQLELAMSAVKPGGRICAVGDDRQAIYSFMGADRHSVDLVIERLSAKVLPLSVTYRCPVSVVKLARSVVPDLEPCAGAPAGLVEKASKARMISDAAPGDFVLSRTNAPLISLCLGFIRQGRRAMVKGRNIGEQLIGFIRRSRCKTIGAFLSHVDDWRDEEVQRLIAKERDTSEAEDRHACLVALCEGCESVPEAIARAEMLFRDQSPEDTIVLSTTHKAKGLETDRVWMLEDTYLTRPGTEESNLFYVAVTRAKRELYLVAIKPPKNPEGDTERLG